MAATIKDIARRLNVSISTVSYALNGGPRQVPPAVREKVLAVARELDYRPNSLARSMATGRTDTIAIVPPRGTHPLLMSPYIQAVLYGVVEAAEALRQDVLLCTAGSEDADRESIMRSVLGGKADGAFLIAPSLDSTLAQQIAARRAPCVVFSADGPPGTITVTTDNAAATRQALDHLWELGHRRIGHIAGRETMRDAVQRRDAYLTFLNAHGLAVRPDWMLPGDFTYGMGRSSALQMLAAEDRPTALLAANDESGHGILDAAESLGLQVPEDLSVVAFDHLPQAVLASRGLSSVRQPIQQMTARAIQLLVEWTQTGQRPEPVCHTFPAELVVERTTAPPPEAAPR